MANNLDFSEVIRKKNERLATAKLELEKIQEEEANKPQNPEGLGEVTITEDLKTAYLDAVSDKKSGQENLEKWQAKANEKIFTEGVTDEGMARISMLEYLAERKGPMGEIAQKFSMAEIQGRFGKVFAKDLYNKEGGSMHVLGMENGRIKIFYKKAGSKEGEGNMRYISAIKLDSLLGEYTEESPMAVPKEAPQAAPKGVDVLPEKDKKVAPPVAVSPIPPKEPVTPQSIAIPSAAVIASLTLSEEKDAPVDPKNPKEEVLPAPDKDEIKIETPVAEAALKKEPVVEKKKEIRQYNELSRLEAAVARAREGYATKDYEVSTVFSRIKEIFRGHLRSTPSNHPETNYQYRLYQEALRDLLTYQVAELKEKDLPPKELNVEIEFMTKYYNQDEKINLYAARTDARMGVSEKPGWLAEKSAKFVNWYRKLNWGTKTAFNVSATLSGVGLFMAGSRVLSGIATGAGITAGLEARHRRLENKRLKEERSAVREDLKKIEDPEEKYAVLMERLQKEIYDYQHDLKNEQAKGRKRRLLGALAGIFIGSGALSHLLNWGHSGAEWLKGTSSELSEAGKKALEVAKENAGKISEAGKAGAGKAMESIESVMSDNAPSVAELKKAATEVLNNATRTVEGGMDSLVKNTESIPKYDIPGVDAAKEALDKIPADQVEKGAVILGTATVAGLAVGTAARLLMRDKGAKFQKTEHKTLGKKEKAALRNLKEFKKLAKKYNFVSGESEYERATKLIKTIALNNRDIWSLMKGAKFSGWREGSYAKIITEPGKGLTNKLTRNIEEALDDMIGYLGAEVGPKEGETLLVWVARVAKESSKAEEIEKFI